MKISDIKAYPTWVGHRNQLIVKVETDEGIYGWGESGLSGRELSRSGRGAALPGIFARSRPPRNRAALAGDVTAASTLKAGEC